MPPSKVTVHPSAAAPTAPRSAEAALVERCRRGDLGAFEEVYRTHSGRLYGLVLRMVGNPSDAEDLLQEIFLSAHRKLEGFRGDSALGTWLYRLATNHCLDHLRSRASRTGQLTDALDEDAGLPDIGSRTIAEHTAIYERVGFARLATSAVADLFSSSFVAPGIKVLSSASITCW